MTSILKSIDHQSHLHIPLSNLSKSLNLTSPKDRPKVFWFSQCSVISFFFVRADPFGTKAGFDSNECSRLAKTNRNNRLSSSRRHTITGSVWHTLVIYRFIRLWHAASNRIADRIFCYQNITAPRTLCCYNTDNDASNGRVIKNLADKEKGNISALNDLKLCLPIIFECFSDNKNRAGRWKTLDDEEIVGGLISARTKINWYCHNINNTWSNI